MKSERRHELQHNELADQLAAFIDKVAPYSKAIVGGILAIVVLTFAYVAWTHQQSVKQGKAWNEVFGVVAFNDPLRRDEDEIAADLEKLAQKHKGSKAALWALLTEANLELESGAKLLFTNREDGMTHLDRARQNFDTVEKESAGVPYLQQESRFGSAQASEAMGDLTKAKEKYDKSALLNPESAVGRIAIAHSKMLAEADNKNFSEWFQHQKPKPINPHAGMPGMGGPGGRGATGGPSVGKIPPLNLDDLPQAPDIKLPGFGDLLPQTDTTKPDADSSEKKADNKVTPKKPVEDATPPVDKPAEKTTDKPADKDEVKKDAPAPDKPAAPTPEVKPDEANKDDAPPAKP